MTETIIHELEEDDLADVARIHQLAFPDSALTHLGLEAIRRYYEWQLSGPHDVLALGAFQEDDLVGFCFGGVFRGALSGFVKKNMGFLVGKVLTHPWLLLQPDFRNRLRLGLSASGVLRNNSQVASKPALRGKGFGILSIAVSPEHQGSGVGKLIMIACENFGRDHGFDHMSLTVNPHNMQAIRFYSARGWEKDSPDVVWRGRMYKMINNGRETL